MRRRHFIAGLLAMGSPASAQFFSDTPRGTSGSPYPYRVLGPGEQPFPNSSLSPFENPQTQPQARQTYSTPPQITNMKTPNWESFFDTPKNGMIVASIEQRIVHFCSEDFSFQKSYLSTVPRSREFEKRGRTEIVKKRLNPIWIPTPDMRRRDPNLPAKVGPGPDNPLGTRALNLGWTYYRIHGIDRPEKVGNPVSSGCFGLYNSDIEELFEMTKVGTQVVVV